MFNNVQSRVVDMLQSAACYRFSLLHRVQHVIGFLFGWSTSFRLISVDVHVVHNVIICIELTLKHAEN